MGCLGAVQSAEVLRLQDELHKEVLAKELRFQEELLSRKTREETAQLKKAYAEDLARNVNTERTAILVRSRVALSAALSLSLSCVSLMTARALV